MANKVDPAKTKNMKPSNSRKEKDAVSHGVIAVGAIIVIVLVIIAYALFHSASAPETSEAAAPVHSSN